jgi:hypothetical protein
VRRDAGVVAYFDQNISFRVCLAPPLPI